MKPPWKFLADLVSRRKPADIAEPSPPPDRKLIEIKARPAKLPQLTSQPDDFGRSGADSEVLAKATTAAAVESGVEQDEPAEAAGEGTSSVFQPPATVDVSKSRKAGRPRQARGDRAKPVQPHAPAANEVRHVETAVSEDPFLDEATSLDSEIRQLRDQLAQKLRLQNDQLKKMLERFERS